MNRGGDAAGLESWVTQLENKTKAASEIIYGFMYTGQKWNPAHNWNASWRMYNPIVRRDHFHIIKNKGYGKPILPR